MMPLVLLLFFQAKRTIIRYEIAAQFEQNLLQEITLKESELIWEEEGSELLVNGKLFDVKQKIQSKDGYISFKGLFDEKESELNEQVDTMLNSKHSTLMLLAKIISLQSPTFIKTQAVCILYVEFTNHSFLNFKQAIYTRSIKKYIPPPRFSV
jgi:hypothetical protein